MTTPVEPTEVKEIKPETAGTPAQPEYIKLKDKWIIWIFMAWEREKIPGFHREKIVSEVEDRTGIIISVFYYLSTPDAKLLEEDWTLGRPIRIPDAHWLETSERDFKRVVRSNRNQ